MKRLPVFLSLVFLLVLFPSLIWAKPTTPQQAQDVVAGWLSIEAEPMRAALGRTVATVTAFKDANNQALYYIVYTQPNGFVIVPGDDEVEPIIGFSPEGTYDPSPNTPLGALVSRDVPGRMEAVRNKPATPTEQLRQAVSEAQGKWAWLMGVKSQPEESKSGISSVSDVRVSPLVQTTWDQSTDPNGVNTYNIYTPNHYVCGCVATAMAQLMRFHQFPTSGVGTGSFTIGVCGTATTRSLRGGNGSGGPYSWSSMVYSPGSSTTQTQRNAISALTYDAGLSVNMNYCTEASGGSSANTLNAATAFKNTFGYSNAKRGYSGGTNINIPSANRNNMTNPNLDAGHPVQYSIQGEKGGHSVICDGYGYNISTMYHHINMGWSGNDNLWYNLPTINPQIIDYSADTIKGCVYNVYVTGSGEIISGRVINSQGNPISGATVTATKTGGGTYSSTTNAKGIYALAKIPSASTYTVGVTKTGYTFTSQQVTTGTSTDDTTTTGNKWGINFTGSTAPTTGSLTVTLQPAEAVTAGAQWAVDAGGWQNSGATVGNLSAVAHTVSFKAATGWVTPVNQTANIQAGQTTSLTGTYTPASPCTAGTGEVAVSLSPQEAVAAGAEVCLIGGNTICTNGGDTLCLSPGAYTASFKDIPGWTKPANQTATVQAGQTTTVSGTYVLLPTGSGGGANLLPLGVPAIIGGQTGTGNDFNEQFTSSLNNWTPNHASIWTLSSGYAKVVGSSAALSQNMAYKNASFSSIDYSVKMRLSNSTYSSGIYFRGVPSPYDSIGDWSSGYWFGYWNSGYCMVGYYSGSSWQDLSGLLTSSAIISGGWNILRVTASGSTLRFYINGTKVWETTDTTLASGKVGIEMYDGGGGILEVDYATLSTSVSATAESAPKASSPHPGSKKDAYKE